jgi:hypothetical protein
MNAKTSRIRALNDELRQHLTGGRAMITPGVAALGQAAVERIIKTIAMRTLTREVKDLTRKLRSGLRSGKREADGPR